MELGAKSYAEGILREVKTGGAAGHEAVVRRGSIMAAFGHNAPPASNSAAAAASAAAATSAASPAAGAENKAQDVKDALFGGTCMEYRSDSGVSLASLHLSVLDAEKDAFVME